MRALSLIACTYMGEERVVDYIFNRLPGKLSLCHSYICAKFNSNAFSYRNMEYARNGIFSAAI